MNVLIVGAGPSGLTLAYLLKSSDPKNVVDVVDRRDGGFAGWGITMPARILERLEFPMSRCHALRSSVVSCEGQQYLRRPLNLCALSRDTLLDFLMTRCRAAGADIRFGTAFDGATIGELVERDVIVGADGVGSVVRTTFEHAFAPALVTSPISHLWMATSKPFGSTLTHMFRTHDGLLFAGWAYQYHESRSSFIVECASSALERSGLLALTDDHLRRYIARVFERELEGYELTSDPVLRWKPFTFVTNARWCHRNAVIVGDAAHTTHFSAGFGTELALKDAFSLSAQLAAAGDVASGLAAFTRDRLPRVRLAQSRATSSHDWEYSILMRHHAGSLSAAVDAVREAEDRISEYASWPPV